MLSIIENDISRFKNVIVSWVISKPSECLFVALVTQGGNMGAQASTILVRGMSVGEVSRSTILRHIRKELLFATAAGLIIGGLATLTIWIWQGAIQNEEYAVRLAFAVGITLFLVCLLGSLTGFVVPFLSHKLRLDAAAVSAPVITTIKDILALLIYFGVASLMLQKYL
jgi:magnesium transporter